MCVILASETVKPTEAHVIAADKSNPWGMGIAWIEKDRKGQSWMRWEKGIKETKDAVKVLSKITPPVVFHARIPTEGLEDFELNHPFPVDEKCDIAFTGKTKSPLLFHNGAWGDWRRYSLDVVLKSLGSAKERKLPDGLLNDSRMLAWNANIFGLEWLQLINEKVIVFSTEGIRMFGPVNRQYNEGWDVEHLDKGLLWHSNGRWKAHMPSKAAPTVEHVAGTPAKRDVGDSGGSHRPGTFRTDREHPGGNAATAGANQSVVKQQVEGSQNELPPRPGQVREAVGGGERRVPLMQSALVRAEYRKITGTEIPYTTLRDIRAITRNPWETGPADHNGMGTAVLDNRVM